MNIYKPYNAGYPSIPKTQSPVTATEELVGNAKVLSRIISCLLSLCVVAQTTLNFAPVMANDLGVETSIMNIAVSITALFSGIFIVVFGGLADRLGRVKVVMWGFYLSIAGSLLVGIAPSEIGRASCREGVWSAGGGV